MHVLRATGRAAFVSDLSEEVEKCIDDGGFYLWTSADDSFARIHQQRVECSLVAFANLFILGIMWHQESASRGQEIHMVCAFIAICALRVRPCCQGCRSEG
eukprot:1476302-Amphidinium_carterae.2